MSEFKKQIMGEIFDDPEARLLERAWEAYYQASDRIDGHIEVPRTQEERKLVYQAGKAGEYAFRETLNDAMFPDKFDKAKSKRAQAAVLRRIRK